MDHPALTRGPLVTSSGEVVGEHDGYARYTVGQRRGIGGGHGNRLYVIGARPETREVVVGPLAETFREEVAIEELNWLGRSPSRGDMVDVQIRHRAPPARASVSLASADAVRLSFDVAQRAVAPGQSAVIFSGDVVLGGGRIARE
jgi:tRNA-specific 2-thiouridylase